jgi:hypothetical protein
MAIPIRSSAIGTFVSTNHHKHNHKYGIVNTQADMNDPWILSAYKQMLLFQNDFGQPSLVFENPNYAQQDVLQSLAHGPDLGLEYEYNLVSRQAFISRRLLTHADEQSESILDQYLQAPVILDSLDLAIHHSNAEPMVFFGQPEPASFDENLFFPGFSPNSAFTSQDDSLFPKIVEAPEQYELGDFIHDHPSNANLTKDQSNSMETVLLRDTPQNVYVPQIGVPGRTCSISSQGRGRVGKMLSRVSSSRSTAGSMFSCFDSKSIQSVVTDTSTSSRRSRRVMDKFAIAAMNAVKAIGACWRCKLLRKQASLATHFCISSLT